MISPRMDSGLPHWEVTDHRLGHLVSRAGTGSRESRPTETEKGLELHLFPAKYRQSARISVIVHRIRQYGLKHLLLDTAHEVRYSAA